MKAKLYLQLPKAKKIPVEGYLSLAQQQALFSEGEKGIDKNFLLHNPEVVFINADGIMLRGKEPMGNDKTGREIFKYQEWYCVIG